MLTEDELMPSAWISIKERLPDSYERVLVAISYVSIVKKEKKFSVHLTEMIPGENGGRFWDHNASEFIEFWQPLPAPPPVMKAKDLTV